jgi:hypothetical protein
MIHLAFNWHFRFAYCIQMGGLGLKTIYYWQFHIWRDLFCHLPTKKGNKNLAEAHQTSEEMVENNETSNQEDETQFN